MCPARPSLNPNFPKIRKAAASRFGQQLSLTGAFHRHEKPRGGIDGPADGQEPVVAKDGCIALAEGVGNAFPLLRIIDHPGVIVEQDVVVVDDAGVLGDGV